MSLRDNLVFSEAWSSAGASSTFPAVATSEAEARTNLDSEHIATKNKINEIVGAIVSSEAQPGHTPDDNHLPTTKYVDEVVDAHSVQSDWNQTDPDALDYIKNKPDIPSEVTIDTEIDASSTNPVQNKAIYQALLNMIYPVGSIYMSVNSVSPASFLGGTWERIQDKFLLAAGSSYAAGATGGAETAALPQHNHKYDNIYIEPATVTKNQSGEWVLVFDSGAAGGELSNKTDGHTEDTGTGTDPISTMPPYLAVYVWKRVS